MNTKHFLTALTFVLLSVAAGALQAQTLKRTTHKTDRLDFGVGGTLAVIGAPKGSIRVEGWANNEIEISAEIELEAATQEDLERLSKVTGFMLEESVGRTGVISVGPHDKKYLKKVDKRFPKHLVGATFRIDYVIRVPRYCDLQIDGGSGGLSISGVEGNMLINYLESDATIDLIGGGIVATIGKGSATITIPTRSWRGRVVDFQVGQGELDLKLPTGLNADFDAVILRTGKIENSFAGFVPKTRKTEFTEKSIAAKAGTGSIPLKFTIGDGTMRIVEIGKPS